MGGIGSLLGGLLGQILPFAKGGIIKGHEHEYIVKVKPHVRRLPEGSDEEKYGKKLARRDKKVKATEMAIIEGNKKIPKKKVQK